MLKSTWDQLNSKTVNYSTIVIRTISWTQGKGNSMVFDFAILKTGQENSHFFDFLFLKTGPGNRIAFDFRFWCCLYRAASWQNQQNDLCAQWRLWSAWASAQSDQSSLSAWRNIGLSGTHWVHCEDSQTGWMPWLIWIFAGHTDHFAGFVMRWLVYYLCFNVASKQTDSREIFACRFCCAD